MIFSRRYTILFFVACSFSLALFLLAIPWTLSCLYQTEYLSTSELLGKYKANMGFAIISLEFANDNVYKQEVLICETGKQYTGSGKWSYDSDERYNNVAVDANFIFVTDVFGRPLNDHETRQIKTDGLVMLSAEKKRGKVRIFLTEGVYFIRQGTKRGTKRGQAFDLGVDAL